MLTALGQHPRGARFRRLAPGAGDARGGGRRAGRVADGPLARFRQTCSQATRTMAMSSMRTLPATEPVGCKAVKRQTGRFCCGSC